MSTSPWLTLIASDIGAAVLRTDQAMSLARLAGRGSVAHRWARNNAETPLRPWQRGLLDSLSIASGSIASAAVVMSDGRGGDWIHAEPVHFAAGLDRLSFVALTDEARVTDAERAVLFERLAPTFASGDFVLHASGSDWFIRSTLPLQVATSTPDAAATNDLQSVMPRGPDAPALRRLMTELQMLLHEHPVNEARARRGLPAINAVWLWGSGHLPEMSFPSQLPVAFGNDAFLRGLYRLSGASVVELPESVDTLLHGIAGAPHAIVVVPESDLDRIDSEWLKPLSAALASGRLSRLDVILDEWHVDARRSDLRRFWRRALPPSQWERRT
jgi:hypothetical protein